MRDDCGVLEASLHPPYATQGMRIGLLGGSFNPPHAAHRLISLTAIKRLNLTQVWWLVTPGNPLKNHAELAPLAERVRMSAELAGHSHIKITAFEAGLNSAYTASTLRYLKRRHNRAHFVWLMGADNLAGFHTWNDWESIFQMMPIAVLDRPNWRYAALASPAAQKFARFRVPEKFATSLALLAPPAWSYLSGPLSRLSSTELRRAREPAHK